MSTRSAFSLWLGLALAFLPSLALELTRTQNNAFSFLFAPITGLVLYVLFRLLCRLYPESGTLLCCSQDVLGRVVTAIFTVLLFLLLLLTALFIEDFGTRIVHSLMQHSDARFYNMILIIVGGIFARKGPKTLGRMTEILLPIFSLLFLLLAIGIPFSTSGPFFSIPPKEVWMQLPGGGLSLAVLLGSGAVLFFCSPELKITAHSKKQCVFAAGIATLYALLFPFLTNMLLGRFLVETHDSSFFLALRQMRFLERFGNMHILLFLPWMMLTAVLTGLFFWAMKTLLLHLFPKLSETLCQILCPLSVLVLLGIRNETNPYLSQWLSWGAIPLGVIIFYGWPLLILLFSRRKSKQPL